MDASNVGERLRRAIASGTPLLDIRDATSFTAGHVRGAVNIPLAELRPRSPELPPAADEAGIVLFAATAADAATAKSYSGGLHPWTLFDTFDTSATRFWDAVRDLGLLETGAAAGRFLWRPSPHLAPVCALVEPHVPTQGRRALDLGCGRGRDAVWLASRGWSVVAVDNQPDFITYLGEFSRRHALWGARVQGVCLDLTAGDGSAAWRALRALLRPPLALVNAARFLHRGLFDFVVAAMPPGCVLCVHHFVEGATSFKSGRPIKPDDANMRSLRPGELAQRWRPQRLDVLLDDTGASCDGGRPMGSFAARKPALLTVHASRHGGDGGGGDALIVRVRAAPACERAEGGSDEHGRGASRTRVLGAC